jgi:hypothetical protein
MSAENPMRWIAGAAVLVGTFVVAAVCSSGPPKALDLKADAHHVVFAENRTQAIAKASVPVAPRQLASKPAPVRKQKLAQNQLPELPHHGSIIAAAAAVSAPVFHGGHMFTRVPSTIESHPSKPLAFTGAQVTDSPRTDVLITARPLRGPPSA